MTTKTDTITAVTSTLRTIGAMMEIDFERPSPEWDLSQLGEFAKGRSAHNAITAWQLGRALHIAKTKNSRTFGSWCQQWLPELSAKTRQRYLKVGTLDFDDVKGRSLNELYGMLFDATKTKSDDKPSVPVAERTIQSLTSMLTTNGSKLLADHRAALEQLHKQIGELLVGAENPAN